MSKLLSEAEKLAQEIGIGRLLAIPRENVLPPNRGKGTKSNSEAAKIRWADPEYRQKMDLIKVGKKRPDISKIMTLKWQDPEYRKKRGLK